MSMLDSAWSLLALLTTNARTSYPWPLCWGNALWGYVAFKQDAAKLEPASQPSAMFGIFGSFVLYTMPANFCANFVCFVRTPSALTNTTIIPVHLACCFLIGWVPGCAAFLGMAIPYAVIDSLGVLDNATTGMNYMEEALAISGSPVLAILAGMAVNLGGGLLRHFAMRGYVEGAASFDERLRAAVLYSFATCALYYWAALEPCGGDDKCLRATQLYEILPWVAVARNLAPTVMQALRKEKTA
tara:strand:- start:204 stop:932 length:729 start_codon:yes stop_codon:yes gene_type:complete